MMAPPADELLDNLRGQASAMQKESVERSKLHTSSERIYNFIHLLFGLPATILAVVVAGLTQGTVAPTPSPGGPVDRDPTLFILATTVAVLTAFTTFFNPKSESASHGSSATDYDVLAKKLDDFVTIETHKEESEMSRLSLNKLYADLSAEYARLLKNSPRITYPARLLSKYS
jgi:hypothetical protein